MKARIHCVTLPVDDLARSAVFYRDGLGLPMDDSTESVDHIAISMEGGLYLVLIQRTEFATFTKKANQADAPRGASECIVSYFAESREEVDRLLERAIATGGSVAAPANDEAWGYAGYVADPDGHLWEIMWNPSMHQGGEHHE